jgi:hypothetical protein
MYLGPDRARVKSVGKGSLGQPNQGTSQGHGGCYYKKPPPVRADKPTNYGQSPFR